MKIGFVRRGYSSTGGAERFLGRLAAAALEAGHETVLFGSCEWPKHEWEGEQVTISGRSPRLFADALREQSGGMCDFLFSLERVWQCDAYRAGDGVHGAWLDRRKAVEPLWKQWSRVFNGKHRELLALETQLFSPEGAGLVIANSEMVKREIVERYSYDPERIKVVYNGLPLEARFSEGKSSEARREVRAELGLKEDDYVVLFAGSGWERKGLRFAVEGVRKLSRRAILLVAGRGSRRFIRASERVRYVGAIHGGDGMQAYYAAADAFILPTVYDPFSNACLEALAAGLPVITTAANGFSEVIEAGVEGEVLADPADVEAVAAAIEAWRDRARGEAVRPRLKALAEKFSIEANLKATLAALESRQVVYSKSSSK